MGGLVERVELEPPAGVADGGRVVAGRLARVHHARKGGGELAVQRISLAALPVLERGGVAQAEALEEVAAEERDRLLEGLAGAQLAEAVDVHLEPRPLHQGHAVARGLQPVRPDRGAQGGEGPHRQEDGFWNSTLTRVAEHFGEPAATVDTQVVCVDSRRQWSKWRNVWHSSAIRSTLYMLGAPVRWAKGLGRG